MALERIEIWDDLECNSGTHQGNIPRHELLSAVIDRSVVDSKNQLTISFDRASDAWAEIDNGRVLRVVYTSDEVESVREYRIVKPIDGRSTSGAETATIKAVGIIMDLSRGMISRTEIDNTVSLHYTLLSLTRTDLVTLMVAAAPSYFVVGTVVDGTTKVETFTFNFDSPLKALQEFAAMEGLELLVNRNGASNYQVQLLTAIGAGGEVPEFRYRKNLMGVRRESDSSKMMNRVYPAGGMDSDGAIRLNVAEAAWEITAVAATTMDLDGSPIYEDDVFNNLYIEKPNGTKQQILDTAYTNQRLTFSAAHGLNVGDKIKIRLNAAGKRLTYVESLLSQASYGTIVGVSDESDLPLVSNLVDNPALANWSGGLPVNWTAQGSPTISEENGTAYTQVGGASAKVICTAVDQGIKTAAITISPTTPNIYYSMAAVVHVAAGSVELYAEHSTEGRLPLAGDSDAATTNVHDIFVELGISGKEWPAGTVTLYVVAREPTTTFYLDSMQLINLASNQPFFDGNAARRLWQRGLDTLDNGVDPRLTYSINVVDLYSADSTSWPYDEILLGGTVLVEDEQLGIQVTTRALKVTRDLLNAHVTKLELSNLPVDVIDIMTNRRRRTRQNTRPRPSVARIDSFVATNKDDGTVVLQVFGGGGARSFMYIVDVTPTMPTFNEVIETGGDGQTSNSVDGSEVTVSVIRGTGATKLLPGERAFVRIVVFPILSAGGLPGATATATVGPPAYGNVAITSSSVVQEGDATAGDGIVTRTFVVTDQVAAIRVYRKKGGWPTKAGGADGPVDPDYDRGTIGETDDFKYADGGWSGGDVVYDVAIPIGRNNEPGDRYTDSYTVVNTSSGDPRIVSAYRYDTDSGSSCTTGQRRDIRVQWTVADITTHELKIYRVFMGGSPVLIKTEANPGTTTFYDDLELPTADGGSNVADVDYVIELWSTGGSPAKVDERSLPETNGGAHWYLCPPV